MKFDVKKAIFNIVEPKYEGDSHAFDQIWHGELGREEIESYSNDQWRNWLEVCIESGSELTGIDNKPSSYALLMKKYKQVFRGDNHPQKNEFIKEFKSYAMRTLNDVERDDEIKHER